MLRSLDHVGRSAVRRRPRRATAAASSSPVSTSTAGCVARGSASSTPTGAGCAKPGAPIVVDPDLVRAFEIEKECYEFIYAATYLPSWLWAPTEGMRGLFA